MPARHVPERIYRVVMRIPLGRVASYGQIARIAGMPRNHRQVGRALGQLVDDGLVPWHRVLGADGRISRRSDDGAVERLQRTLLEDEGVVFDARGRVSFDRFGWKRVAPPRRGRPARAAPEPARSPRRAPRAAARAPGT